MLSSQVGYCRIICTCLVRLLSLLRRTPSRNTFFPIRFGLCSINDVVYIFCSLARILIHRVGLNRKLLAFYQTFHWFTLSSGVIILWNHNSSRSSAKVLQFCPTPVGSLLAWRAILRFSVVSSHNIYFLHHSSNVLRIRFFSGETGRTIHIVWAAAAFQMELWNFISSERAAGIPRQVKTNSEGYY